jgi:small-conductance mechanosensitive channel
MEWSSSSSWSTLTTGLKHSNNLFLETFFMSIVVCNTKDLMGINKGTLLIITTTASKLFKDCCSS